MSYLNDEPMTPEEEKAVIHAERQYNYQNRRKPPKYLKGLPVPITANISRSDYYFTQPKEMIKLDSDYFKISIPASSPNCFQINSTTYECLVKLIHRRYGYYPKNGNIICDSITIMPIPNQRCCLYYRVGENKTNEPGEYELISSFVADRYTRKLSVCCPYADSLVGEGKLIFNWFGNDKTGRIVPKTFGSEYEIPCINGHMPWLMANPYGSFFIYGICDAIGFHCSFIGDPVWKRKREKYRLGKSYLRKEHIPSKRVYIDDDIGYEIPSQDIQYDTRNPDPLIKAFNQ